MGLLVSNKSSILFSKAAASMTQRRVNDVTMWRHAIVSHANWPVSHTFCSIVVYYQAKISEIEICDIVTRSHDYDVSHDHDVTAKSEVIMQVSMLWQFLIEWSQTTIHIHACIHGHRIICLATPQANIDGVSYVTSYSHAHDVIASLYDKTTYGKCRINDIFELVNPKYNRNKKRTISLARLQAEIDTACLMTS